MKVRVTKAPSDKYWYSRHIGEVIEVSDTASYDGSRDVIDWQGYSDKANKNIDGLYIEAGDFEVVDSIKESEEEFNDNNQD